MKLFKSFYFLMVLLFFSGFNTRNHITETIKSGSWEEVSIWSNGLPSENSSIIINHKVVLPCDLKDFHGQVIINDTLVTSKLFVLGDNVFLNYSSSVLRVLECLN